MCYIVFISHGFHWRSIKVASFEYVIIAFELINPPLYIHFPGFECESFLKIWKSTLMSSIALWFGNLAFHKIWALVAEVTNVCWKCMCFASLQIQYKFYHRCSTATASQLHHQVSFSKQNFGLFDYERVTRNSDSGENSIQTELFGNYFIDFEHSLGEEALELRLTGMCPDVLNWLLWPGVLNSTNFPSSKVWHCDVIIPP